MQCNTHGRCHNVLIGVQVAQPQMARAADTVVAAGQYRPLMRQRVVVAYQTYRVRIGLCLLNVCIIGIIVDIIGVGIGVGGGGDLGGGELGRRVGTVGLAAAAVADHRGAGTAPATAVPAAIVAAAPAGGAATGHATTCILRAAPVVATQSNALRLVLVNGFFLAAHFGGGSLRHCLPLALSGFPLFEHIILFRKQIKICAEDYVLVGLHVCV